MKYLIICLVMLGCNAVNKNVNVTDEKKIAFSTLHKTDTIVQTKHDTIKTKAKIDTTTYLEAKTRRLIIKHIDSWESRCRNFLKPNIVQIRMVNGCNLQYYHAIIQLLQQKYKVVEIQSYNGRLLPNHIDITPEEDSTMNIIIGNFNPNFKIYPVKIFATP